MYDAWLLFCSDELLSQATRVDGILYLPAYDLAHELFVVSIPLALLLIFVCGLVGSLIADLILLLIRYIRAQFPPKVET